MSLYPIPDNQQKALMKKTTKKLFAIALPGVVLLGILLVFFGRESRDVGELKNNPKPKPELSIRFALELNPANRGWITAKMIKDGLEARSNGRIEVMFYDSGMLGSDRKLVETCYLGVIEMVQCTTSVLATVDPVFGLLDMPYLFVNEEHQKKVLNGPIGCEILDGLREYKLQGLVFYPIGFRNMFNTKGIKIRRPQDLNGLKIRVMESPIMVKAVNYMGASATPLSAGEVFQSLKTGVVDGAENNPQLFVSEKYYEAGCTNYSMTRHFANQSIIVVNRDWFDGLKEKKPELYEIIRTVPAEILEDFNRLWDEAVKEAMIEMEKQKVLVNETDDITEFIERVRPIYEEFFKKYPKVQRGLLTRIRGEAGK